MIVKNHLKKVKRVQEFDIVFYTKGNGEKPAQLFIDGLEPKRRISNE
ncbi:MAG: hypothetical protein FWH05_01815 [Oscillospiraceae bacterium]|nr:hypothetical protein [Oscillospiraceae bacterium]